MGTYGRGCRWGMMAILIVTGLGGVMANPGSARGDEALVLKRTVPRREAGRLLNESVPQRLPAEKKLFALVPNDDGDVSLAVGGVSVDVSYNNLLPEDEGQEQLKRITQQQDPLINGIAVKLAFHF
ncbi:hypothetical protein GURASL_09060 [Geotalea uraniireducens]|uniref:Uncharacterized protein n=1 Tax=Geotalea uraniireducens TaxID=351604 RepID=A0ABM8EHN2_9BACT|nr:hypothetical protein [Geotalea uraniireducens]BDV41983.1 hypothetical protein GURASL_09060 [Geotalea uraniireducens]